MSSLTLDLLTAGGILFAFAVAIFLIRLLWERILGPFVKRTNTPLDDAILVSTRSVALWGLLLMGLYYAISSHQFIRSNAQIVGLLSKAFGVAWVVFVVWTLLRLFSVATGWYVRRAAEHPERARDISHQAGFARKVVNFVLLLIGLLYVLRAVGVDISPLLTSSAIGGLAVALALQDTLSNLFAGFSLAIDRPVRVGDFIELESGEEGFIEDIGWRNTKVRLWANNLVVIPNSKLSQSVITNYYLPQQEMSVYVPCGVSYDSDLQRVEAVVVEVAKEVLQRIEGADANWEPIVRWKEFGDFAITFVTVLRVKQFAAQYALQSEFIKALHKRFKEEGIDIPFPIRTVIMKDAKRET